MVWLPCGDKFLKICLFVLTECTNVTDTDRRTPHDDIGRACIQHRAAKTKTKPAKTGRDKRSRCMCTCKFASNPNRQPSRATQCYSHYCILMKTGHSSSLRLSFTLFHLASVELLLEPSAAIIAIMQNLQAKEHLIRWYGIVGFNVPLDTIQVISETILRVSEI